MAFPTNRCSKATVGVGILDDPLITVLTNILVMCIIKIQGATDRRFALMSIVRNNHPRDKMGGCFFYFL